MSKALRHRRVEHLGIALFTNANIRALHLPPSHGLNGYVPETGWMAISEHMYQMDGTRGAWWWLKDKPYLRVGKSIRLYNITGVPR